MGIAASLITVGSIGETCKYLSYKQIRGRFPFSTPLYPVNLWLAYPTERAVDIVAGTGSICWNPLDMLITIMYFHKYEISKMAINCMPLRSVSCVRQLPRKDA
jgi:hypothetical protein